MWETHTLLSIDKLKGGGTYAHYINATVETIDSHLTGCDCEIPDFLSVKVENLNIGLALGVKERCGDNQSAFGEKQCLLPVEGSYLVDTVQIGIQSFNHRYVNLVD